MLAVSLKRKDTPVLVTFLGYDRRYDEWVGADRLRSKHIVPKRRGRRQQGRCGPRDKNMAYMLQDDEADGSVLYEKSRSM